MNRMVRSPNCHWQKVLLRMKFQKLLLAVNYCSAMLEGRVVKEKQNHTIGIKGEQLIDQIASAQIRLYDKLINLDIK